MKFTLGETTSFKYKGQDIEIRTTYIGKDTVTGTLLTGYTDLTSTVGSPHYHIGDTATFRKGQILTENTLFSPVFGGPSSFEELKESKSTFDSLFSNLEVQADPPPLTMEEIDQLRELDTTPEKTLGDKLDEILSRLGSIENQLEVLEDHADSASKEIQYVATDVRDIERLVEDLSTSIEELENKINPI